VIGVLVSGQGTNLQALLDAGLPVVAVASNRGGAPALERASCATAAFELADFPDRAARDEAMADWLEEQGVRLVVLAGYMHLLTPGFLDRFPDAVVNVHPSLLPAFPGAHAVEEQLAAGVAESGATVHLVDEGVDSGPVLAQERIPVLAGDTPETLHGRIKSVEHRLLPDVVRELLGSPAVRRRAERAAEAGSHGRERPASGGSRRALISTWDKSGLDSFARGLVALGWRLVASGNTAAALEAIGLPVERVEDVTASPEMLGGRVKTLHPRVHAGILARRDEADDLATLEEHGIEPFDLVCVNLYPFEEVTARRGVTEEQAVETIDVGGPSMLRGAAKNFAHCAPVCRPEQYHEVLEELRTSGELSLETRRRLAAEAFAHTAAYEAAIATWFNAREEFPDSLVVSLDKVLDLAYGENPHQRAAYYAERGVRRHLLSRVEQLHGKELSFNNLNDFSAARSLAREFALPACVIVKHANPCGVAVGTTAEEAYDKALASDPTSAYGGVVVLNREVEAPLGEKLTEQFVEVLFAPGYTEDALDALRRKKNIRILLDGERRAGAPERSYKRVIGGMLVQDSDAEIEERDNWELVTGELDEPQWGDLVFAWRVCKHVASNAIVLVKDLRTIGIGAGQMSRVDAVRIAVEKAAEFGHDVRGSALASDAFFPFPDGPQIALDAGTTSIVQPGGSRRDEDVIAAVAQAGAAMAFTGRRHFRH
jgi:phosphoribosylaminoimidazolecarboxamide formyltransferase / IMP cyclohydrolase